MDSVVPGWLKIPLEIGIVVSNYLCGLACVTSTSRMLYAFARDGGLPGFLKKVSPTYKVPVGAIWIAALLTVLSTLYAPAYTTLTAACVIFLYISYIMPTMVGIFAYGKTWTKMGPFNMGPVKFKTLGCISIAGVVVVIYAGIQPPNDPALPVTAGAIVVLILAWFLGIRKVFAGPPILAGMRTAAPVPIAGGGLDIKPA
jgi:amino acid transporter